MSTTPNQPSAGAMRAAHTPGPWHVAYFGANEHPIIKRGPISIAEPLYYGSGEEARRETESNAHLIASAPDLLRERDEWREKYWNAHHHSQEFFKDLTQERTRVAELVDALGEMIKWADCYVESAGLSPEDEAMVRDDMAQARAALAKVRATP